MRRAFLIVWLAACWTYLVQHERPISVMFDPATDGPIRIETRPPVSGGGSGSSGIVFMTACVLSSGNNTCSANSVTLTSPTTGRIQPR